MAPREGWAVIRLGYDDDAKSACVSRYVETHGIRRVVALGPARFRLPLAQVFDVSVEHVEWAEIILYRFYYRLLRETDGATLLVLNEPLRTQNRHDLTYNCLRNFLQQTKHQIVFSRFPQIDTFDDFMVLVDLETRSRWRREPFRREMLGELDLEMVVQEPSLRAIEVETDGATKASYTREKRKLIDGIGSSDPHTIPRRLHLHAGKAKLSAVEPGRRYVGRNNRFKLENLATYEDAGPGDRDVFEFCHRFLDWSDFLVATGATKLDALVTDLKVDRWYFERFTQWAERIRDGYAALHG